jgi:CRISPR-associated exonuclease Cas4
MDHVGFSDLRTAAYCPRQLYYVRRDDDRRTPPEVERIREVAFQYGELAGADDATLRESAVDVTPDCWRANLRTAREAVDAFDDLVNPPIRDAFLEGKDCRGIAHKVLEDPPRPSLVSAGTPPERGVYRPQSVAAVAAAKALSWEREREVDRAFVEYPAHGVVRAVDLTTRRTAAYRRTLRAVRSMDGPPARLTDRRKCESCSYREQCGVHTRSLRSLLGR